MIIKIPIMILSTLMFLTPLSCGGSSGDDDSDEATTTQTDVTDGTSAETSSEVQEENPLTGAYPSGLAISVFPQSSSASLTLAAGDLDKKPLKQKVDDSNKRLVGEGDCFSKELVDDRPGFDTPTCYEFDSGMMPFKKDGVSPEYGTLDGTDGAGEACLVAFARSQMTSVVARLEKAMFMVEAMMCQAKKAAEANGSTLELPSDVGSTLDLTDTLKEATSGVTGINVNSAKITRKPDASSRAVYHNQVSFSDPGGRTIEINLVHSPDATGSNDNYNGTLWTISEGGKAPGPGPGSQSTNKKRYLHINYSKTTSGSTVNMQAEMRRANILNTLDPITSKGELDLNVGATFTGSPTDPNYGNYSTPNANDTIEAMKYISFNMNPDTNEGSMSYWVNPGGNYFENARGFVFNVTKNTTTNTLEGCAVTGATQTTGAPNGISIRRALREGGAVTLEPRGYYHPFADNNLTTKTKDTRQPGQSGASVSKQCFSQNATSFKYEIDSSKTTSYNHYPWVA